jgi:hypothetical protein
MLAGAVVGLQQQHFVPSSAANFVKPESDDEQRSDAEMEPDDEQQVSDDDEMLQNGDDLDAADQDDGSSSEDADDQGEEGYGGNAAAAAAAAVAAAGSGVVFGFSHDGDGYNHAKMQQEISLTTQTTPAKYGSSGTNKHATWLRLRGRITALLAGNEAVVAVFKDVNRTCGVKKKGQDFAGGSSSSSKRAREVDEEEGDRGMQRLLR